MGKSLEQVLFSVRIRAAAEPSRLPARRGGSTKTAHFSVYRCENPRGTASPVQRLLIIAHVMGSRNLPGFWVKPFRFPNLIPRRPVSENLFDVSEYGESSRTANTQNRLCEATVKESRSLEAEPERAGAAKARKKPAITKLRRQSPRSSMAERQKLPSQGNHAKAGPRDHKGKCWKSLARMIGVNSGWYYPVPPREVNPVSREMYRDREVKDPATFASRHSNGEQR